MSYRMTTLVLAYFKSEQEESVAVEAAMKKMADAGWTLVAVTQVTTILRFFWRK